MLYYYTVVLQCYIILKVSCIFSVEITRFTPSTADHTPSVKVDQVAGGWLSSELIGPNVESSSAG